MHSSLIDSEGFPLANVDVYSVRHARQAVICALDDRQKLTDRIEALMHELHAITKQERPSPDRSLPGTKLTSFTSEVTYGLIARECGSKRKEEGNGNDRAGSEWNFERVQAVMLDTETVRRKHDSTESTRKRFTSPRFHWLFFRALSQ